MSGYASIKALQARFAEDPLAISNATEQVLRDLNAAGRSLRAVIHIAEDDARRQVQARCAAARGTSPLFGVPLAHKELYMRAGWPCEAGSKTLAGNKASRTSFAVHRLDDAGAIDCGRLTSVEFGLGTTGHNAYAGTPANPWNRDYICGGSSSGSAAVIAAGIIPASLGSDTGGSVRLPAAACGLVGIKPTHGLVGRSGVISLSPTLDTVGPLARSVEDAAIVLQALLGTDDEDSGSIAVLLPDLTGNLEAGIDGLRIGWPTNHFFEDTDAAVGASVADVFRLAGCLGAICSDVAVPGIETANAMTMLITAVEGAAHHERAILENHSEFGAQTLARLLVGAFIPARDYHNALVNRAAIAKRVLAETFAQVDVLVTPVWPYPLPSIQASDIGANPEAAAMVLKSGRNTRPVNYLGFPAVVLPVGFDAAGLPMSVQLVGAPFSEPMLLRLARTLERKLDFWHVRPVVN